jgi:hypothetical protein
MMGDAKRGSPKARDGRKPHYGESRRKKKMKKTKVIVPHKICISRNIVQAQPRKENLKSKPPRKERQEKANQ